MIMHVRLREGRDDDLITWYEAQEDKSDAVRSAIRAHIRLHNGDTQEAIVKAVVAGELARLPDVVAQAVRESLSGYRLADVGDHYQEPEGEDPELAARLDEQLTDFFGE